MPAFNMIPILFPKKTNADLYDMLRDSLDIRQRELSIEQGGEIYNPESYDELIKGYSNMVSDPSLSAGNRRSAEKKMRDLEIQKLKTDLARKKEISATDLKQRVQRDLRELEFEMPNNPVAYSAGALSKYQDILYGSEGMDGLYDLIETLDSNYADVSGLESYKTEVEEEVSKYADILDAYERGDMQRLSEYAVVYTPHAGKIKAMEIIHKGSVNRAHSAPTNMNYSRDAAGNLITGGEEVGGMPIYFVKANAGLGDSYQFGNLNFDFDGQNWTTDNAEGFNLKDIKHAPVHSIPFGGFVKDSKGQLFYINRDRSFTPIRNDAFKDELGYAEDKVYNLSPSEEINTLPGAISPIPFEVEERWNREVEMSKQITWQTWRDEMSAENLSKNLGSAGERVKDFIGAEARSFGAAAKRGWISGQARSKARREAPPIQTKAPIQTPAPAKESQDISLEGLKKNPLIEGSQKFLKGLPINK